MDNNVNNVTANSQLYEAVQAAKMLLGKIKLEASFSIATSSYDHKKLVSYLKALSFEARVVSSMGGWVLDHGYYTFSEMPKTNDIIEAIQAGEFDEECQQIGWVKVKILEDSESKLPAGNYYHQIITTRIETGAWKEA